VSIVHVELRQLLCATAVCVVVSAGLYEVLSSCGGLAAAVLQGSCSHSSQWVATTSLFLCARALLVVYVQVERHTYPLPEAHLHKQIAGADGWTTLAVCRRCGLCHTHFQQQTNLHIVVR
jgi:hypothetical protein